MFKNKTKVVTMAVMAFMLVGCGGTSSSSSETPSTSGTSELESSSLTSSVPSGATVETLKVWGSKDEQTLLRTMAQSFKARYDSATKVYQFGFGVVEEPNASATVTADLEVAADVFMFADDQLADLVNQNALAELTGTLKDRIAGRNNEASIASSTYNNKLWAYPFTNDNGYFLYYNKAYLNATDVLSFDTLLAKTSTTKQLVWDFAGAWYNAGFFMGTSPLSYNAESNVQVATFNGASGLAAAKGAMRIAKSYRGKGILAASVDDNLSLFKNKDTSGNPIVPTAIAGISGTWNLALLKENMGTDFAATKLPTFKAVLANETLEDRQMYSFTGSKLVGVKSTSTVLSAAQAFADWITNEDNQILRYTTRQLGPSNTNALASTEVQSNEALQALAAQNEFAQIQSFSVGADYWTPAGSLGTYLLEASEEEQTVQEALDAFVNAINLSNPK